MAASVVSGACEAPSSGGTPVVRSEDSLGIAVQIVDWAATLESTDTVSLTQPIVRVGVIEGDVDYEFDRVAAIVPLGERGFAVADGGRRDIRVFGWDGELLSSFGQQGDGPGEFQFLTAFAYRGDSIAAYDRRNGRVTLFSVDDGGFRSLTLHTEGGRGAPTMLGVFADGRILARQRRLGSPDGMSRTPFDVYVYSPVAEVHAIIGEFPGDESFARQSEGFAMVIAAPFPSLTFGSPTDDELVVADGAIPAFTRWRPDGSMLARWRSSESKMPLLADLREAHRDSLLQDNPFSAGMAAAYADGLRDLPYPDSLPFFSGMTTDRTGRVWLSRVRPGEATPVWAIIERDGRVSRFVRTRSRVSILTVTETRVFVVATDALDVEYVEVYELPGG